jgi:hypothetical protein
MIQFNSLQVSIQIYLLAESKARGPITGTARSAKHKRMEDKT